MPHTPRNIQSPYTATDFWNRWSSVNPRMALFMKVSKVIGGTTVTQAFTSNTRDMELPGHPGITFRSAVGISPTAVQSMLNAVTTMELQGIYQSGIFERTDVVGGKWDFADVEIFSAAWDLPALGELVHFKGNLGDIKDYGEYFTAEGRGLIARLSQDPATVTSRNCRVKQFKNAECGFAGTTVTIGATTYALELTSTDATWYLDGATDKAIAIDASLGGTQTVPSGYTNPPTGFFDNGTVTVTAGNNAGITREILRYEYNSTFQTMTFFLKRAFPFFQDGEITSVTVKAGCNRTVEDCKKYGNIINFRGEPYVPGIESMNRIPSSN